MKTTVTIILGVILISLAILFLSLNKNTLTTTDTPVENVPNVSIENGKQIIEIKAKGGYLPRVSKAKSGIQTVLRFNTSGTFDCSASVRIPTLGISEVLPISGAKDIDLGVPKAGVLNGTCSMGMYPFEIDFN